MKLRDHDWLDMRTKKPVYGLQCHTGGRWMNCAINGAPVLCPSAAERDAIRARIRAAASLADSRGDSQGGAG